MSSDLIPIPARELGHVGMEKLQAAIARAGKAVALRFIESLTANIRNRNTRAEAPGLPHATYCRTLRATGITAYLGTVGN